MSILLGPFDGNDEEASVKGSDDDLLVFGYACKLYRDEAKSIMENSGQLLIPWMGDSSLMVDRYDVRNKLDDKCQFGLKPNLPRPMTTEEMDFEDELDKERYLALEWDEIRVEEQEEMEKRKRENSYNAIGFSYNTSSSLSHQHPSNHLDGVPYDGVPLDYNLQRLEHPSTSTVDLGSEKYRFVPCAGLVIPSGMQTPSTNKLHSIIEKTASFISKQGTQMEIIIKIRQKFNPFFSFLNHEDVLYPYFKHLKEIISMGSYIPQAKEFEDGTGATGNQRPEPTRKTVQRKKEPELEKNILNNKAHVSIVEPKTNAAGSEDESDSDDGGGYLHPLLLGSSSSKSKTTSLSTPTSSLSSTSPSLSSTSPNVTGSNNKASRTNTSSNGKKLALDELLNLHSTSMSFMARSRAINSAPSTILATEGEVTQAYATDPNADPEAVAAYEFYRQQYYDSSNVAETAAVVTGQEGAHNYGHPTGNPSLSYDGYEQQQHYSSSNGHYPPLSSYDHYDPSHSSYDHQYPAYYQSLTESLPPPEIRSIVDKTAEYVAKNSENFERTVLDRHLSDPRFSFLNPWDPYHPYYEAMKQYNRSMLEPVVGAVTTETKEDEEVTQRLNIQKLSSSGAVSFKLQPVKVSSSTGLLAPPSGFEEEAYSDDVIDDEEEQQQQEEKGGNAECGDNEQEDPPAKKQKLEDDLNDEIGDTVQAFLSTVKGLFTQ